MLRRTAEHTPTPGGGVVTGICHKLHRVTQWSYRQGISGKASTLLSLIQRNICTVLAHAPGRGVVPGERPVEACGGGLPTVTKQVQQLDRVIIRFAGDSGDGMQLAGDRFTQETAVFGNDLSTLPNFPAEIRAPAGTLPGVSSFQVHFADHDILTPGDRPRGGTIIVDTHDFTDRALARVGWKSNPLDDGTLDGFTVHAVDLTQLTLDALAGTELSRKDAGRSKNMFALGLLSWMYSRPVEGTLRFLRQKFANKLTIAEANITAFKAGWNYGETTEAFAVHYEVKPAALPPGTYRNITGNTALAYGLLTASNRSGLPLFLGAYPITPASDILHELSKHKRFGVRTFQAEDE